MATLLWKHTVLVWQYYITKSSDNTYTSRWVLEIVARCVLEQFQQECEVDLLDTARPPDLNTRQQQTVKNTD